MTSLRTETCTLKMVSKRTVFKCFLIIVKKSSCDNIEKIWPTLNLDVIIFLEIQPYGLLEEFPVTEIEIKGVMRENQCLI